MGVAQNVAGCGPQSWITTDDHPSSPASPESRPSCSASPGCRPFLANLASHPSCSANPGCRRTCPETPDCPGIPDNRGNPDCPGNLDIRSNLDNPDCRGIPENRSNPGNRRSCQHSPAGRVSCAGQLEPGRRLVCPRKPGARPALSASRLARFGGHHHRACQGRQALMLPAPLRAVRMRRMQ
jgi:hypothetical protein